MPETSKEGSGSSSGLPTLEQSLSAAASQEALSGDLEQTVAAAETTPVPGGSAPAGGPQPPVPAMPVSLAQPSSTVNGAAILPSSGLPVDDNDSIEKEWVSKAKRIVESTRDDPYRQSENLTLFKADYMKKRYGKSIKVSQ